MLMISQEECWRISVCMLHQHMEQPDKTKGLLNVETWHNKEQWKRQKHSPFHMRKRLLVQYSFEIIQRTIDTAWKIWSMSIHPEEFRSNMITSRGCFFFPLPVLCPIRNLSASLYFFLRSVIYSKHLNFFISSWVCYRPNSILSVRKSSTRELCILSKTFSYKLL